MGKPHNLTAGQRFAKLTVVSRHCEGRHTRWLCLCDCGKQAFAQATALIQGRVKSCGCHKNELVRQRRQTHGHAIGRAQGQRETPEYRAWCHLKERCYNPHVRNFDAYGGRGITVCDRWRHSFEHFIADMGPRPSAHHSLDRIDNDGPYAPDNCRWATRKTQTSNMRSNRLITHDGETLTLASWADRFNIPRTTMRRYLIRADWQLAEALHLRQPPL